MAIFNYDFSRDFQVSDDETSIIKCINKDIEICSIPEGVKQIENSAFKDCRKLKSVILPKSLTKIGRSAFFHCDNLTSFICGENVKFDFCPFCGCNNLPNSIIINSELIYVPKTTVGRYSIPNGVIKISDGAFCECNSITEITIPTTVTELGVGSFQNCM